MPVNETSASQLTQQKRKRYIFIIFFSLVVGITAGVMISKSIHNSKQIEEATGALTIFSSLLDEKRISKVVSAVSKLAAHPQLIAIIAGEKKPDNADVLLVLEQTKYFYNISLVNLMDAKGEVIASLSYAGGKKTFTGKNYSFRPYFVKPMETARNYSYIALGVTTGKRGIYFSAPVYWKAKVAGVVVIKIDLDFIDQELAKYPYPCALLTKDGIIFASNRPDWLYKAAYPLSPAKKERLLASRQFADKPLTALPVDLHKPGEKLLFEGEMVVPVSSSTNLWGFSYIAMCPLSSPPLLFTVQISLFATLAILLLLFTYFIFIDRRRLFNSLKMRDKDYHAIINNLKATFYRINNDNQFIQVSPSMVELYLPENCTTEDMIGSDAETVWKYPEKREEYLQALTKNSGRIRDYPCQLIRRDGSTAHVLINASYFFDKNGVKQGIEGLIHDVSEILQLQQRLLLLDSAVQAASNSMAITDVEGDILWVNPAFTLLTGYGTDEAVGQNMNIQKSGYHDDSFYKEMWQTITSGRNWFGELINKRKDGSTYSEEMSITPIFGEDGNIINYIAIKNDISSRKKQEEEKEHMLIRERILTQRIAEEKIKHSETSKMEKKESVQDLAGINIILITDNSFERLLIPELLSRKNILTSCIEDSSEVAKNLDHDNYVLILLDMPLASAVPIMKEIRHQGKQRTDKLPVILITADRFDGSQQEAAAINITDHIHKPIDPEQLFAKITQWLPVSLKHDVPGTIITAPPHKTEMILDRVTGLKRVMGNEAMYEKLLKNFKKEFRHYIEEIILELERNNLETVKRMIHTLKGASGSIGGDTLQKACEEMEKSLLSETDQQKMMTGFEVLTKHLSDLLNEITPTEEITGVVSSMPDGNEDIIYELYEQFGDAVQSGKFKQGQQLAKELEQYNWSETDYPEISELQQLLDSYTFDQAAELFHKIKHKRTGA